MYWQWPRVAATDSWLNILLQGARSDLMTAGLFAAPIVLLLPIFAVAGRVPLWVRWCTWWLVFSLIAMLFLELATPQFLIEFDSRPNRLFIDYLLYPREVLAMLWGGYRMLLIVAFAAVVGLGFWTLWAFQPLSLRDADLVGTHRAAGMAAGGRAAVRDDPLELSASARQFVHVCVLRRRHGEQPGGEFDVLRC